MISRRRQQTSAGYFLTQLGKDGCMLKYDWPKLDAGNYVPPKVWAHAMDCLVDYIRTGEKFVEAGRPFTGELSERFAEIEQEYNRMTDCSWFHMSQAQIDEWNLFSRNASTCNRPEGQHEQLPCSTQTP
jgi:hypothetical protein